MLLLFNELITCLLLLLLINYLYGCLLDLSDELSGSVIVCLVCGCLLG
jgi:hypothetical protein